MDIIILLIIGAAIGGVAAALVIKGNERELRKENARLRKQVEDLLSGDVLPPEAQKKVDAIFEQAKKNAESLSKGISDNEPKSL